MTEILADYGYADYIERAGRFVATFTKPGELTQCDMVNYECSTNERYDAVKTALLERAVLLSEIEHGGRLISILQATPALAVGQWQVPYIELLQPKPTRENIDGVDSVFFVANTSIEDFVANHAAPEGVAYDDKGLKNKANPYVEYKAHDVAVKIHDLHMGAVLRTEKTFTEPPFEAPNYGGHVTL